MINFHKVTFSRDSVDATFTLHVFTLFYWENEDLITWCDRLLHAQYVHIEINTFYKLQNILFRVNLHKMLGMWLHTVRLLYKVAHYERYLRRISWFKWNNQGGKMYHPWKEAHTCAWCYTNMQWMRKHWIYLIES